MSSIYKQKCFLHLIQQPKYGMAMPCKADYSPAKSFYDVKNLSGLIYLEGDKFLHNENLWFIKATLEISSV